jgi:hypothetical protein
MRPDAAEASPGPSVSEGGQHRATQAVTPPAAAIRDPNANPVPSEPQLPGRAVGAALALILLVAASLRFAGLNWDDNQHQHPDERHITMTAQRIHMPSGIGEYFDTARSPLSPYQQPGNTYVYGTLPLFFVRAVAEWLHGLASTLPAGGPFAELVESGRRATEYNELTLLGRGISAVADLLTVFLTFLIGRRLYGSIVGIGAALLAAFTVLQIQSAHFFTVDSPLTFLVTLAFYLAVRAAQSASLAVWILLGIAIGLATATKINALLLSTVVLTAWLLLWYRTSRTQDEGRGQRRLGIVDMLTVLPLVGVVTMATFRIAQPYAFSGPGVFDLQPNPTWLADLETWRAYATGEVDYPPGFQWAGTPPYLWQLSNMVLWGMGPPLAIAAWMGFILIGVRLLRGPRRNHMDALILVWVGLNFAYWGIQFAKPMRYLLPIYPQLAICAALFLVYTWEWARSDHRGRIARFVPGRDPRRFAVAGTLIVVTSWTVLYALAFTAIYTRPMTRVTASQWIYDNVPAGSRIWREHWDDGLPLRLDGQSPDARYQMIEMPMYMDEDETKRAYMLRRLDEADYIILASNRLHGSIPRMVQRFPMTTRYYSALFAGELGFERVATFTSRPAIAVIELNDDHAEETFTVYDHPRVDIFKKSPRYSSDEARRILDPALMTDAVKVRAVEIRSAWP